MTEQQRIATAVLNTLDAMQASTEDSIRGLTVALAHEINESPDEDDRRGMIGEVLANLMSMCGVTIKLAPPEGLH